MAFFLYPRIRQTVVLKQFVKQVCISYSYEESYGNEYLKFEYDVEVHEPNWEQLSLNEQETAFEGTSSYTFSISTNATRGPHVKSHYLLRVLEFRNIYESLTAYAITQLEEGLNPGTSIKVQDISKWTEANYAKKYLLSSLQSDNREFTQRHFDNDIWQWKRLHSLARKTRKIYVEERGKFKVTDIWLHNMSGLAITDIRDFLLRHKIPMQVEGIHTIDVVIIHAPSLVVALKQELLNNDYGRLNEKVIRNLMPLIYKNFLDMEQKELLQQQQAAFLNEISVQRGDILELADRRVVWINSIALDKHLGVHVEYLVLKNNLQPGKRRRIVKLDHTMHVLKENVFTVYLNNNSTRSLSLLKRWMTNKKMPVYIPIFRPDLLQ